MNAYAHTNEAELNLVTEVPGETMTVEELEMVAGGQAVINSI